MNDLLQATSRRVFGSGQLAKQVATLLSGTATAQALTVLAKIPLARLYGPEDFGLFTIAQSVVTVGVTMVALRFDLTIVLPRSDVAARVLYRLASRAIAVSSAVLSVALLVAHPWIERHYANQAFATWTITIGLATYLMAQVSNVQFWLTRREEYGAIAGNRMIGAVSVALSQVAFALWMADFRGLIAGLLLGQAVTLLLVRRRTPELRDSLPADAPTGWELAKRYRKMPLLNGPTALLDAVKQSGINVLIGNIALSGLGQFSLAYQMTKAPVSLLTSSVAQVLLQRLATTEPGGMVGLLRASFARIFLFAAPAFAALYWAAPALFPFVFGAEWAEAGELAQALVPWLFMLAFTSPLSSLMVVAEKQEWALVFAALSTAIPLAFLALTPLGLLPAVRGLALIMAGLLLVWIGMAFLVARDFDRRGSNESRGRAR